MTHNQPEKFFVAKLVFRLKSAPATTQTVYVAQDYYAADELYSGSPEIHGLLDSINGLGAKMGQVIGESASGSIFIKNVRHSFGAGKRLSDLLDDYYLSQQEVVVYAVQNKKRATGMSIADFDFSAWYIADSGAAYDSVLRVFQWSDESGNSRHFTQSTDGYKPLLSQPDMAPVRPIVHFRCEDNAASTAVINSGTSGTNGTANRNTNLWSTASGKIGRGLDFYNGSIADKIDLGSDVIAANGAFTFCVWAKPHSGGDGPFGKRFFDSASGEINFYKTTAGGTGFSGTSRTNTTWTAGILDHFCITRAAGATVAVVFKNGVVTESDAPLGSGATLRYIGDRAADDRSFDGMMDDIRIYDYALTPAQIAAIYNGGNGTENTSAGINGHRALVFDGVDDGLTGPALSSLVGAGAKTLFFVTMPFSTASCWIFGDAPEYFLFRRLSDGKYFTRNFDTNSDALTWATAAANNSVFVHAVTHDGTNLTLSQNGATPISIASGDTGSLEGITRLGGTTAGYTNFHGQIAEIMIASKVLSTGEIQFISNYLLDKYTA